VSRILDPAFYELRTKPLPTLPERRRLLRERLAKERGHLARFVDLTAGNRLPSAAHARVKENVEMIRSNIGLLEKALAYLGEPDPRLDLYRLFGMELPIEPPKLKPWPTVQLELFAGMPPLPARGPPRHRGSRRRPR